MALPPLAYSTGRSTPIVAVSAVAAGADRVPASLEPRAGLAGTERRLGRVGRRIVGAEARERPIAGQER